MRAFYLDRQEDASGVSGTGRVAEGVVFSDGSCALRWLTKVKSTCFYPNLKAVKTIHGHDGKTNITLAPLTDGQISLLNLHREQAERLTVELAETGRQLRQAERKLTVAHEDRDRLFEIVLELSKGFHQSTHACPLCGVPGCAEDCAYKQSRLYLENLGKDGQ